MNKKNRCLLTIIIPMYNEQLDARDCIDTVMQYIGHIPAIKLIVVNDGSTDGTKQILEHATKKHKNNFILVNHQNNRGYGAAIRSGIKAAEKTNCQYVLFMDADLTNHPNFLQQFVRVIPNGYDCVKASRYMPGGGMVGVPAYRQLISKIGNIFARLCFKLPIHDYTNGFRMIKLEKIIQIPYTMNNFSLLLEEMFYLKKMKASFFELPHILSNRQQSTSHFTYSFSLVWQYAYFSIRSLFI